MITYPHFGQDFDIKGISNPYPLVTDGICIFLKNPSIDASRKECFSARLYTCGKEKYLLGKNDNNCLLGAILTYFSHLHWSTPENRASFWFIDSGRP
jgi:hypothetical protein